MDLNPQKPQTKQLVLSFDKQQGRVFELEKESDTLDTKLDIAPDYKLTKKRIIVLVDMNKDKDRFKDQVDSVMEAYTKPSEEENPEIRRKKMLDPLN